MLRGTVITLLAIALWGCAAAQAAAKPYGLKDIIPFEVLATDGTVLRGDVYLPTKPGPLGTVLGLSPYWNTVAIGQGEAQADSYAVKPFVEVGFAVALVNLRGTGESDGCFQLGSRVDWRDSHAVVEALADQPWSNGRVGMYGISYDGWTQYMAMATEAPSLKAVVPISGVIDPWSLLTRQGAPISVGPVAALEFGGLTSFGTTAEPAVADHARCPELAEHAAQGAELARTGDRTVYWALRDLRPHIANSEVPVLMTNGLRFFDEGHELQFEGLWRLLRPDRTRFVLGQWGHGGTRDGFNRLAVGWFDRYLRDGPEVTEAGVVEYQSESGHWHTATRWPPPSRESEIYLSGHDLISRRQSVEHSARTFVSADVDTAVDLADVLVEAPTGDPSFPVRGNIGPACGPHQVLYVSPPLAEEVLVAGNFVAELSVTSTLPGGNLVATLYRTPGDASCTDLLARAKDVGRVQLDLRHWADPGESRPFPVGEPVDVAAESLPLATEIPAGQRLVLVVGAGSAEIEPDPLKPAITIRTGSPLPGSLTLPVVDGNLRFRSGPAE